MTLTPQFKKGFLKFQRLGPVKFAEQSRWASRVPETKGLWAFPYPHFDVFFAYHKFTDIAPKDFRDREPSNPKWYSRGYDDPTPCEAVEFIEVEDYGEKIMQAYCRDENGKLKKVYPSEAFFEARNAWIENVGKKVLPLREFWYSGLLYTHFLPNGEVGGNSLFTDNKQKEWTLMTVEDFYKFLIKPGSVHYFDGHYDGEGKPLHFNYSKDHLEVFIPRGKGIIRDKL